MFSKINLCGPRVFALPHNTEVQMCQLFHSYHHMFHSFHMRFKELFITNDLSAMTEKQRRRRRLLVKAHALHDTPNLVPPTCTSVTTYDGCDSPKKNQLHIK